MPDLVLLTDEQLDALTPEELEEYEAYLEAAENEWALQPKQQRAEDLSKVCDIVGYGGAAGGGKSEWGLWHVYHLSLRHPRHRSLVLRSSFPELRRSLITRSLEKFDQRRADYKAGEKEWHFDNGSVIEFGYLETDEHVYQYKSAEYDCIFFDEATEFSEFAFDYLRSRARTPTWKYRLGVRPHIISATNPGGRGHAWYKRRLVTATDYGQNVVEVEVRDPLTQDVMGHRTTAFVPATLHDNEFIDPDYKLNLMMLPETEMRQLYLGDWDTFAGQFFSDWSHDLHVVAPFAIPESWTRVRGIDYGYAAPYCALWVAFDQDGAAWAYREDYEAGLTPVEQARRVLERSKREVKGRQVEERIAYTVADPSIWNRTGTGLPVATQYRDQGLVCKRAMNARVDGWARVRELLRPRVELDGTPAFHAFPVVANLIRTLPDLVMDKDKPEDLDTTQEDHAADTLRYIAMSRPRLHRPKAPRRPRTIEEEMAEHLDELVKERTRPVHDVLGRIHV